MTERIHAPRKPKSHYRSLVRPAKRVGLILTSLLLLASLIGLALGSRHSRADDRPARRFVNSQLTQGLSVDSILYSWFDPNDLGGQHENVLASVRAPAAPGPAVCPRDRCIRAVPPDVIPTIFLLSDSEHVPREFAGSTLAALTSHESRCSVNVTDGSLVDPRSWETLCVHRVIAFYFYVSL